MRSRQSSNLAKACALLLPLGLAALALSSSALTVVVTAPTAGFWTASDMITVNGTAAAPNPDRRTFDTTADFSGGTEINVNTTGDRVTLQGASTESYQYLQDFTGLTGSTTIDAHWTFNLTAMAWAVTNSGSPSAAPPSLAHTGTTMQHVQWNSLLPGPLVDGHVAFTYLCEANAFMNVVAYPNGLGQNTTFLLGATGGASGSVNYNLSVNFSGARVLVVAFDAGASSAVNSACAIDDFDVVANVDVTQDASRVDFVDNFSAAANSVWNGDSEGGWAIGGTSTVSDSPPALYHFWQPQSSVWANWGAATPILNATVSFHYQCEVNGAVQAYLSRDGTTETLILNGARGAVHTLFTYNATTLLNGSMAAYLRITSDGSTTPNFSCGVDDFRFTFNVTGYLNLTYTGTYFTRALDLGAPAALDTAEWIAVVPPSTAVAVSFRSSADNVAYSAWTTLSASGQSVAGTGRYVQFRVNLTTDGHRPLPYVDRLGLNFAALVRVEVSVNGGPWAVASGTSTWTASVALAGGSNNITARVTDTSGATVLSVVQVWRDTYEPSAPGKPVGLAVTNQTSASWTWAAATDFGLGIDHYKVDVGLTPGGAELGAGLAATGTNFTMPGLPDNVRVYATVWAVDAAGLTSLTGATSDATLVDRTAPGAPAIRAQTAFTKENSVTWNWTAAPESGSGVSFYAVRVGTTPGGSEVETATTPGLNYVFAGAVTGESYYLSVAGVDVAGNRGAFAISPSVTVDQQAPSSPAPVTGPPQVTNNTALTWSWTAATDSLSGVDHYGVVLGTTAGGSDVDTLSWVGTSYTASSIAPGVRYFFEVRAVDLAGNVGPAATAASVLVDDEPPSQPLGHALATYVAAATVTVTWNVSVDQPSANASGVDHYAIRVSDGTSVTTLTSTANETNIDAVDGVHYSVSIAAVDRAGNEGGAASVAFTSDRSGPSAPQGLKVVVLVPAGPTMQASWEGTADNGSGVKEYRISIGTTPGGTDVANARVVTTISDKWTGVFGKTYYVTVWAVDVLGNAGAPNATSEGVTPVKPAEPSTPGLEASAAVAAVFAVAVVAGLRRRR